MNRFSIFIAVFVLISAVVYAFFFATLFGEKKAIEGVQGPAFMFATLPDSDASAAISIFEIPTMSKRKAEDTSLPMHFLKKLGDPREYFDPILSSSGAYLAFNRNIGEPKQDKTNLVILAADGKERSVESGSAGDIGIGMLTPLQWSADEKTLYAFYTHATEGNIVGLVAIDVATLSQQRIEKIDDLRVSNYVFDEVGNTYGFEPHYRFRPEDEAQTTFYRISLTSGETKSFTLQQSSLDDLLTVDPSGRYLVYANGDDFNSRNIWMYDMETGEERALTENAVVNEILPWKDGYLVFLEESVNTPAEKTLVSYDVNSGIRKVLLENVTGTFRLLGWYP
ncbi:MAG: hypothetical protein H6760_01285 [Candidatus Nomurabacteria bacterium]|nr:MAG: hypothetical protein H6760_01285 [Candidatus Nomurabacteria bacterium]